MTNSQNAELRQRLAGLDGVEQVLLDEERREAALVLRADVDPRTVEEAAVAAAGEHAITLLYRPERRDRQRVRYLGLQRTVQPDQQVAFTVSLEWAGTEYTGRVVGEKGPTVELRTVAAAALTAIAALVPHDVKVRLAGVKLVRAFDAEMVVVSVYRPDDVPHNLVGAVVAGDDPLRASATAVLSALNRLLGNYLALP